MIFLSHNHNDKPFVEGIASELAKIYGQDKVFYDSWSIQPGDGIIDKMNKGLSAAEFFFFFISENSINSKMVSLEWQNALMIANQNKLKFIPIKCDDVTVPTLIMQNVYLNLFTDGVDAVIAQMKDIIDSKGTFKPQHSNFSNLSYSLDRVEQRCKLTISASHFLEPIADFMIFFDDNLPVDKIKYEVVGEPMFNAGCQKNLTLSNGEKKDAISLGLVRGITKTMPMEIKFWLDNGEDVNVDAVFHKKTPTRFEPIPLSKASSSSKDFSTMNFKF